MTPRLPRVVQAAGGKVRIKNVRKNLVDGGTRCAGWYDAETRTITLDAKLPLPYRWKVLFHELVHVALMDAGLDNGMKDAQVERLCDAIATARHREKFG